MCIYIYTEIYVHIYLPINQPRRDHSKRIHQPKRHRTCHLALLSLTSRYLRILAPSLFGKSAITYPASLDQPFQHRAAFLCQRPACANLLELRTEILAQARLRKLN